MNSEVRYSFSYSDDDDRDITVSFKHLRVSPELDRLVAEFNSFIQAVGYKDYSVELVRDKPMFPIDDHMLKTDLSIDTFSYRQTD
jgi:hypothetical protein